MDDGWGEQERSWISECLPTPTPDAPSPQPWRTTSTLRKKGKMDQGAEEKYYKTKLHAVILILRTIFGDLLDNWNSLEFKSKGEDL